MAKAIVVFIVCAIAIGLVGNGYAHKAEVIGDYKVEVGWENEPPIVGQKNAIEIIIVVATEFDKESHESEEHMEHEGEMEHDESIEHEGMTHEEHDEEMKMMEEEEHEEHDEEMGHDEHDEEMGHDEQEPGTPVSGLSGKLEAVVSLNGKKTNLVLAESAQAGVYHADYTPADSGFPMVNLAGEIGHEEFEITFHPEKVEDLSILAPLKQIHFNISPSDVECKSEKILIIKSSNGSPACVNPSSADKLESLGWGIRA